MRRVVVGLVVFSLLTVAGARPGRSCQYPPMGPASQVTCHLHAATECWRPGEPLRVVYTLTNRATEEPFPPPYQDDQAFRIWANAWTSATLEAGGPPPGRSGDYDNDGVPESGNTGSAALDNCPEWPNPAQEDHPAGCLSRSLRGGAALRDAGRRSR